MKPTTFLPIVLATAVVVASNACAQTYPAKPVRVVVPFPPGGGVDFVARTVAQRLGDTMKQTFVIENRTGASGMIGADAVAKSAPDGYTLLVASPAEVLVGPIAGQKVPYDAERDLQPVTLIGETPLVIVAHPSVAVRSLQDVFALAKKQPGKLSYGTPGNGSTMHFAGESLNAIAGISIMHVPYRGAAPAVADLLGGQVPLGIVGMPPTVPHAKSGRLRVLAVTSSERSMAMPDVPAVAELAGFAGYRFTNWMGIFVPAKTPQQTVERLARQMAQIVRETQTSEKLLSQGVKPVGNSPSEFVAFLEDERGRYSKIARERNIHAAE
ncbi:MAG: tripartite tricarboxylate transporter substrate binding protein [Betaproteobacteria bacterium]|nr:MAG: tripartite tricarboxylate transporter substrate binding protein [Betaproteobacteria bacterium]